MNPLVIDEKSNFVGLKVDIEKTKYKKARKVASKVHIGNYDFEVMNNFINKRL